MPPCNVTSWKVNIDSVLSACISKLLLSKGLEFNIAYSFQLRYKAVENCFLGFEIITRRKAVFRTRHTLFLSSVSFFCFNSDLISWKFLHVSIKQTNDFWLEPDHVIYMILASLKLSWMLSQKCKQSAIYIYNSSLVK